MREFSLTEYDYLNVTWIPQRLGNFVIQSNVNTMKMNRNQNVKIKVHPSSKIIIIPSIIYWPLFKGCCIFISILQYQSNWYVLNLRRSSLSITPSVDPPPHSQKPIPPQPSTPQPTALLVTPAPTQSPLQCNPYYKEAVIYLGTGQRKNPCNFEKKYLLNNSRFFIWFRPDFLCICDVIRGVLYYW